MKYASLLSVAAVAVLGLGAAQASAADASTTTKVRSPESIECSKEADAKNLHGKPRKEFRSKCLKEAHAKKPSATDKKS